MAGVGGSSPFLTLYSQWHPREREVGKWLGWDQIHTMGVGREAS